MLSTEFGTMLLEALHVGACLAAGDGRLLGCNTGLQALLGASASEIDGFNGRPFAALFEEFSADLASEILRLTAEEGHWHGDVLFVRPGTRAPLPVYLLASRVPAPLATSTGEARFLLIALDYSDQHYAISDRIRRQTILQRLLASAPLAIVAVDDEGRVAECNERALRLWEQVGVPLATGLAIEQAIAPLNPLVRSALDQAQHGEEAREDGMRLIVGTAEPTVDLEVIPAGRRRGQVDTLLLFIEDRTEALKAEARLRETERFASLGLLAANMAHEINNPLQGLQGALERLERRGAALGGSEGGPQTEVQRDIHESVARSLEVIERMRRIIAPVLDLARPHPPQIARVDLVIELKKLVEILKLDPALAAVDLQIVSSAPEESVETDAAQLGQLLTNVLLNGAHALAGSGTIRLELESQGAQVTIDVRDSGPGVAEADAPHLFTPFFTTKPVGKGTGLGLYLSRSIAQRLGGWLEYVPEPGPGACFRLTLPRTFAGSSATSASVLRRETESTGG